ncbi:MAG: ABC transporter permease [Anaerolineales bacterium]|nr:ABC transporter permease [Anaerolineales bacterium]
MSPFVRFLLLRLLLIPLTLLIVTGTLMFMLTTIRPEIRALQYLPYRIQGMVSEMTREQLYQAAKPTIEKHHLEDPFPVQYAYWVVNVFSHGGGYSPTMKGEVFSALLRRTPVTAELTLYSLLLFIPLGVVSGLRAGWKQGRLLDWRFRIAAYGAANLPPFITALFLLAFFYVFLGWFPPGRLGTAFSQEVLSPEFQRFTGLMTIDSLLNWRLDIFLDSVRHLVLPVVTLSMVHWATLGRIVRSTIIIEARKEYLTAARARGIPERRLLWRHGLRNILAPALSSSALTAASLFTGVFMIEIIFDLDGVADLVVNASTTGVDVPLVMGFCVYSISVILVIMFVLDVLRAILDPRSREAMIHANTH